MPAAARYALALVFLISLFAPVHGLAQMIRLPLADRVNQADTIVEGEVVAAESFWDDDRRSIFTAYTLDVTRQFKGAPVESTVTLVVEGGIVGMDMVKVTHTMDVEKGDMGLFFLKPVQLGMSAAKNGTSEALVSTAGAQSFVRYLPGQGRAADPFRQYPHMEALYSPIEQQLGRAPRVLRTFDAEAFIGSAPATFSASAKGDDHGHTHRPQVSSITSNSVADGSPTAGALEVMTITGSGFTDGAGGAASGSAAVFFSNADNGGASLTGFSFSNLRVQSFTDTEVQVQILSGAGTGRVVVRNNAGVASADVAGDDVTIDFAIANEVLGNSSPFSDEYRIADLYDDNGNGGYTFTYHTAFESSSAKDPFARALESLRCDANIFVNFEVAGTAGAVQCPADDGVNSVAFDNGCGAGELDSGTLGRATSRFSGQSLGSAVNWRVSEIDIVFNFDKPWNFSTSAPAGGENDFETVALHEIGHTLGLGHVIDASKVMHFSATTGTSNRTPTSEMTAGGAFMMALSTATQGGPEAGTQAMTALTAGNCSLPVELVNFEALQTDQAVVLRWDTASETNNAGFDVEQAYGDQPFEQVAFVPGAGTTLQAQTYAYRLTDLEPGTYRFRLRQVDFDGSFEYSPEVETRIELAEAFHLTAAYPNPFSTATQLDLMVRQPEHVRVVAFDALGRQVDVLHDGVLSAQEAHTFVLNAPDQPSGVYFVQIQAETFRTTRQVLLVR
ncbi:MAG: matrixin family metalloprotease [Bacteroidota bacterium]